VSASRILSLAPTVAWLAVPILATAVLRAFDPLLLTDADVPWLAASVAAAAAVACGLAAAAALGRALWEAARAEGIATERDRAKVREAADLLVFHRISGLPVLDGDGELVGVVTEHDIIGKQGETVADIMSRNVISVDAETRLEDVAATMTRERINRLPVLQDGRLAGIISRADVVRWAAGR
jgi:hypothetical protein